MAPKNKLLFVLVIMSPMVITATKDSQCEASAEEKKVAEEIKKQSDVIKRQQQKVKELVDRIATEIESDRCRLEDGTHASSFDGPPGNDGHPGQSVIIVNGMTDVSPKQRGHNVVAIDQHGTVIDAKSFDTWGDPHAGKNMAYFINSLPDQTVVLISVRDSGNKFVDEAVEALRSLGATKPLKPGYRESWLLVGYKGTGERPAWITQAWKLRFAGLSYLFVKVFL